MCAWRFVLILCSVWQVQAFDSTFVGFDGKQYQNPVKWERNRLRRFLGLRHKAHHHAVVITEAPMIHKGLHMLNHRVDRVGPLQVKMGHKVQMLKPFGRSNHSLRTLNNTASPIATYAVAGKPEKGWDKIKLHRANMCVKMLKKHGMDFTDNKDKCVVFMDKTCKVPDAKDPNIKRPSGEGVCIEWYDLLDAEYEKQKRNGKDVEGVEAPSPAVVSAAAPASAPEPPGGVSSGGRPSGWSRMDEGEGHPEQGFQGELVAHDNMKTMTSDWHAEYGPHANGHQSYEAICAQYPDNTWCKLRGYRAAKLKMRAQKSAAIRLPTLVLTLAAPLLASLCW